MQGVTLLDFSREDQQQVLTAKTAVWDENRAMWEFRNGRILNIDAANNFTTSANYTSCLLYTSPSPRDRTRSRMPSSA